MRITWLALVLVLTACGGSSATAVEPTETEATSTEPAEPGPALPEMTTEECEAGGGTVVGDIGDGAIHRMDYVCPSGQRPTGSIPLGVEGSVCCPP